MHAKIEDWKNGWFGVELGLSKQDIDSLIDLLKMIRETPEQHFHISSDYNASGGLGDIQIYIQDSEETNNMQMSGKAIAPGANLQETKLEDG